MSGLTFFNLSKKIITTVRTSDSGYHLDVLGFSNLPAAQKMAGEAGNETELDLDFCLTWSNDPRYMI